MGKHIVWNDEKGLGHTSRQRNNLSSASCCILRRCRSLMGEEQSVNSVRKEALRRYVELWI